MLLDDLISLFDINSRDREAITLRFLIQRVIHQIDRLIETYNNKTES